MTGRPVRVVGWYHSHPHITVWPSHVGQVFSTTCRINTHTQISDEESNELLQRAYIITVDVVKVTCTHRL